MARHALRDERDQVEMRGLLLQRKERNERWKLESLGPRLFGIIYYRNLVLHLLLFPVSTESCLETG